MPEAHQAPALALDDPTGIGSVLVVTAHPDDVDFGAAGTIASWVKAGAEVAYCVATNGDAGGSDRSMSHAESRRCARTSKGRLAPRSG